MKIILLNYPYLREELRQAGVDVIAAGMTRDSDIVLPLENYSLDNILSAAGFTPDWIVFTDSMNRVIPRGLEDASVPLAACFIDSTINRFWQEPLARLFDLALMDQLNDAQSLKEAGSNAHWFPLAADSSIYRPLSLPKQYDVSFIGYRNPETRMKRENILRLLGNKFNLNVLIGDPPVSAADAAAIYNRSRLVLNENMFPSVNLRLFEAMGCGAALLTEENDAGLDRLFVDGEHLITYNPDNLLQKVEHYLTNETRRESVAARGCKSVHEHHTMTARAGQLLEILGNTKAGKKRSNGDRHAAMGEALMFYAAKWPQRDPSALPRARWQLKKSIKSNSRTQQDAALKNSTRSTCPFDAVKAGLNLGKLYALTGDNIAAERCFRDARDSVIANEVKQSLMNFLAPLSYGIILHDMGEKERGRASLCEAERCVGATDVDGSVLTPGSEQFHLFWGRILIDAGLPMIPGLMQFHLSMTFWTALEHLRRAAEINPVHWELVGDLLMEQGAPDQALQAYLAAGSNAPEEKMAAARRGAYWGDGR